MKLSGSLVIAALLLAGPRPAFAAEDMRSAVHQPGGAFAGFRARLPLGEQRAKPSARLMLGSMHKRLEPGSVSSGSMQAGELELGLTGEMKPNFYVAGQSVADVRKRLGLRDSGNTWLIVGGVLVAAAAAILIFSGDGSSACIPEDPDCN